MNRSVVSLLVLLAAVATPFVGGVAATDNCEPVGEKQVCIQNMSVSADEVVIGEQSTLSVTVENIGSKPATPSIALNTVDPNNETGAYRFQKRSLQSGESTTITQSLNASTPGTHGLRLLVRDRQTGQRYDFSAVQTIQVRTEPVTKLGGEIDRPEYALAALLVALVGSIGLGYRVYRGSSLG